MSATSTVKFFNVKSKKTLLTLENIEVDEKLN
jgi:hypothetical protein